MVTENSTLMHVQLHTPAHPNTHSEKGNVIAEKQMTLEITYYTRQTRHFLIFKIREEKNTKA